MRNSVVVLVVALVFGLSTIVIAENPPKVAEKLPVNLKELITENLEYPKDIQEQMLEGDVWMKICVSDESAIKVVDISSTNPELGVYVKNELSSLYVENPGCESGKIFYLKVKFDLTDR